MLLSWELRADEPYKEVLQIRSLFLVNLSGVVLSQPNHLRDIEP